MVYPSWAKKFEFNLVERIAVSHGLSPHFVMAVAHAESAGNPFAARYEPDFRYLTRVDELAKRIHCTKETMAIMQKTSWGLMQVMGSVAYEHGLIDEINWDRRWPTALSVPAIGLNYGCRHLKLKYEKYGPNLSYVYAAYNAGSPRFDDAGRFVNQDAVDRVLKFYKELKQVG